MLAFPNRRFVESASRRPNRFAAFAASALIFASLAAGCSHQAETPHREAARAERPDPASLLREMIAAYQQAERYADRGVLKLRYREQGRWIENEAPMSVAVEPGGKLNVEAYVTRLTSDGKQLQARVTDPETPELQQQLLTAAAPEQLKLQDLFSDPVLRAALLGAPGRQPVQLELLLAENPLAPALADNVSRRYVGMQRVEGRDCHGVEATTEEGPFVFWIDAESRVLRRLEYPSAAIFPELNADDVKLIADLRDATFDPAEPPAGTFTLADEFPETTPVAAFVLPPSPLPSQLFGRRIADYAFVEPTGNRITDRSLDGQIAVLMWFNLHPACQVSLQGLAAAREALGDEPRVAFYAICTEPDTVPHARLEQFLAASSARGLTLLRDFAAHGRDRFQIPGAPALVVLDARGVVQIVEVGVNPQLDEQLPIVLERLLRGDDLAGEIVAQYERDVAAFRNHLETVQPESASVAP